MYLLTLFDAKLIDLSKLFTEAKKRAPTKFYCVEVQRGRGGKQSMRGGGNNPDISRATLQEVSLKPEFAYVPSGGKRYARSYN